MPLQDTDPTPSFGGFGLRRDKQEDDKQEESDEQEEGRPATPFVKPDGPAAWFYFIALASLTGVVIAAVVNERWVTPVDKIEWLASGFEAVGYMRQGIYCLKVGSLPPPWFCGRL